MSLVVLVSATPLSLTFQSPTPLNASFTTNNSVEINVSIVEDSLNDVTYNWNGTSYDLYNDSLVLMMNFDNYTRLNDTSIYGYNATNQGAIYFSGGRYNGAYIFDGASSYIDLPSTFEVAGSQTISVWINTTTVTGDGTIVAEYNSQSGNVQWDLQRTGTGDDLFYTHYTSTGNYIRLRKNNIFTTNDWMHILVVYNDTDYNRSLYINGEKTSWAEAGSGTYTGMSSTPENVEIGSLTGGSGRTNYWQGVIDELMIWNSTVNDEQAYEIYASNLRKHNDTQWYLYVNQSQNATTGLENGTYTYFLNVTGNATENEQISRSLTVGEASTGLVNVTNLSVAPSSPITYSDGHVIQFNSTITSDTGTVDTVFLQFNGTNQTTLNPSGSLYSFTIQGLEPGSYPYQWIANDTTGATNYSEGGTFVVDEPFCYGATFIARSKYNVCYTPNVTSQYSLNITDLNNLTLLSYRQEIQTGSPNVEFNVQFSDPKNFSDIHYVNFNGTSSDGNITSIGTIYFSDELAWVSTQRESLSPSWTGQRMHFYNYNIDYFINQNATEMYRTGGSGIWFNDHSMKFVSNMTNFSMEGWSTGLYSDPTTKIYSNNFELNTSAISAFNVSFDRNFLRGGTIQQRDENVTEAIITFSKDNLDPGDSVWRFDGGFLINFHENASSFNDAFATGYVDGMYEGLLGYTPAYDDCFGSLVKSCGPWRLRSGLRDSVWLQHNYNKSFLKEIDRIRLLHNYRLYMNETDIDKSFVVDYNFDVPTSDGFSENLFNHTHTRLVADSLLSISEIEDEHPIINKTAEIFINYLQSKTLTNGIDPTWDTIAHSSNTKQFYDNEYIYNTHSIGTVALLRSLRDGRSVNDTLLNSFIRTLASSEDYAFNETNGNDSYYALSADENYFASPRYGNEVYLSIETNDLRVLYSYDKNESLRTIANRKLNEIVGDFNGSMLIHNLGQHNYSTKSYGILRWRYQGLNITAFSAIQDINKTQPEGINDGLNLKNVPNDRTAFPVYYPLYITPENTTFFLDEFNSIKFETPAQAMISDYRFDNSSQGMQIKIKWAYNTSGNFSNLSAVPYEYFYDPQNESFMNWTEQRSFTATESTLNYWTGNITDSISLEPSGNDKFSFKQDDVVLGTYGNKRFDNLQTIAINISYDNLNAARVEFSNGTNLTNQTGDIAYQLGSGEYLTVYDSYEIRFTDPTNWFVEVSSGQSVTDNFMIENNQEVAATNCSFYLVNDTVYENQISIEDDQFTLAAGENRSIPVTITGTNDVGTFYESMRFGCNGINATFMPEVTISSLGFLSGGSGSDSSGGGSGGGGGSYFYSPGTDPFADDDEGQDVVQDDDTQEDTTTEEKIKQIDENLKEKTGKGVGFWVILILAILSLLALALIVGIILTGQQ